MMKLVFKSFALIILAMLASCSSAPESVWIDVRTVEEYNADHIDGDDNIPLASIDVEDFAARFELDTQINLYCRSGNRAGQAKAILEAAGFTNVINQGGIDDARALRSLANQ